MGKSKITKTPSTRVQYDEEETMNEEEREAFMKAMDKMTNQSMETIKKVLLIPFIYAIGIVLKLVPGLTRDLYQQPTYYEQSFTVFINSQTSDFHVIISPVIYVVMAFVILKCRGSLFFAVSISILAELSESSFSFASQNSVYAVTSIVVLGAFYVSQKVLYVNPYGLQWFGFYIVAATLSVIVLFVSMNYLGVVLGMYMSIFISSISRLGAVKGSKPKMVVEVMLLLFTSYIVFLPAAFMHRYLTTQNPESVNLVRPYVRNMQLYVKEWDRYPSVLEFGVFALAVSILFFGKYRYTSIVPLIQIFVAILGTYLIQVETPGEAAAYRFYIIKTLLMIASGIIFSAFKIPFIAQLLVGMALILQVVYRLADYFSRQFN
ncbi:hypothetical protein TVAG_083550 [Trichomonas vaginalis G3]|uniref:Uncharacterized protein n=1 Tax=Trichomonas vaginalis (strain ATCC PRA-98 / G3) TaxID=412133 RepID=A2DM82_TRIV3|nr:hypothetical protein TVAGG3_0983770 [Trichomonas vaginalis G3]EAY18502.1 hypothetical protein TVAG_083550 [Trichomonas vaginalis G3]KAI5489509.1 hypothetical protein TVAGG3_0983770 [Trichomonas vaginalis G3]|eukprot:XP_001579488.1 hypothetical protein [Trichomonas vaginalis G3]